VRAWEKIWGGASRYYRARGPARLPLSVPAGAGCLRVCFFSSRAITELVAVPAPEETSPSSLTSSSTIKCPSQKGGSAEANLVE